jgi:hypothetical protein
MIVWVIPQILIIQNDTFTQWTKLRDVVGPGTKCKSNIWVENVQSEYMK